MRKSRIPEYMAHVHMRHRCYNEDHHQFKDYGGRGISIHEPWIYDFDAFFAYIGPRPTPLHSLDRINNDGNYEPGNVKWSTRKEQQNNRRNSRRITDPRTGETRNIGQWADHLGVGYMTIHKRLRQGWNVEDALYGESGRPGGYVKHKVEINGVMRPAGEVAKALGLNPSTFYHRTYAGWTLREALGIDPAPVRKTGRPRKDAR